MPPVAVAGVFSAGHELGGRRRSCLPEGSLSTFAAVLQALNEFFAVSRLLATVFGVPQRIERPSRLLGSRFAEQHVSCLHRLGNYGDHRSPVSADDAPHARPRQKLGNQKVDTTSWIRALWHEIH